MTDPLIEHALLKCAATHFAHSAERIVLAEWGNQYQHGPGAAMQAANWLAERGLVIVNGSGGSPTSLPEFMVAITEAGRARALAQRDAGPVQSAKQSGAQRSANR
jgi:hypothetical protein